MRTGSVTAEGRSDLVWYAAYGSNMHFDRLAYYLDGGSPPNAARTYPGCRDRARPLRTAPVYLPGELVFALESRAWTGGLGLYVSEAEGWTPARAYLMSVAQFSDVAAQEMYRETGSDLDVTRAVAEGRATLGPGRYETLVCLGELHEHPVLTFTSAEPPCEAELNSPAPAYLRHLASGLAEAHGWDVRRIAAYLAGRPGAAGNWDAETIAGLIASPDGAPGEVPVGASPVPVETAPGTALETAPDTVPGMAPDAEVGGEAGGEAGKPPVDPFAPERDRI